MVVGSGEGLTRPVVGRYLLRTLLILLGLSLSLDTHSLFPFTQGLQLSADIVRRSYEYHREIVANDALEAEIRFLQTAEGARWAVFRYLGLVKPGQEVGRVEPPAAPVPQPMAQPHRVRGWITNVEESGAQTLLSLGETLACYGDLRPLDQAPPPRNELAGALSKEPTTHHQNP